MSKTRIKVPQGMCDAVGAVCPAANQQEAELTLLRLEAALRWQAENPPAPNFVQCQQLVAEWQEVKRSPGALLATESSQSCFYATTWVRRMYDAPEPVVPDEIKDIDAWFTVYFGSHPEFENIKRNYLLAFYRGQTSK